jgi:hypothetical protein
VHGTRAVAAFAEAPQAQISLAGRFGLSEPGGGRHLLDGSGRWEDLVPLLALRHAVVRSGTVDSRGGLVVTFEPAFELVVDPGDRYEAWGMSGPGSLILACPPGGGNPRIST